MTDETKHTHFVLTGQAVASSHAREDDARTAGIKLALTGKDVAVVQLVATMQPNRGVTVTAADGTTSQAQ